MDPATTDLGKLVVYTHPLVITELRENKETEIGLEFEPYAEWR